MQISGETHTTKKVNHMVKSIKNEKNTGFLKNCY